MRGPRVEGEARGAAVALHDAILRFRHRASDTAFAARCHEVGDFRSRPSALPPRSRARIPLRCTRSTSAFPTPRPAPSNRVLVGDMRAVSFQVSQYQVSAGTSGSIPSSYQPRGMCCGAEIPNALSPLCMPDEGCSRSSSCRAIGNDNRTSTAVQHKCQSGRAPPRPQHPCLRPSTIRWQLCLVGHSDRCVTSPCADCGHPPFIDPLSGEVLQPVPRGADQLPRPISASAPRSRFWPAYDMDATCGCDRRCSIP